MATISRNKDWILLKNESRRVFSKATWIPLKACSQHEHGELNKIGYVSEFFGCGSVAFPPEYKEAADKLGWNEIGLINKAEPNSYQDGDYSPIEEYKYYDEGPIGINLVFDIPQPIIGDSIWMLNPDLIVALRLIKEGSNWVRPEENFVVVAREVIDSEGKQHRIEIKREFLIDYLAARNLSLRLTYFYNRIVNVASLENSEYMNLVPYEEQRDNGKFALHIKSLNDIFSINCSIINIWRTDVDENEDAPVMGPESNDNTEYEQSYGHGKYFEGIRVEGEFWRDEWIEHQNQSKRVRGDKDFDLPQFIVETDGKRMASADLNHESIGRWLWFRPSIVNELLGFRGFSLKWLTAETGVLISASGRRVHFGLNTSDLITVYACDIACLATWEQYVWAAHNIAPEGKVSYELLEAQVKSQPAQTQAVENLLYNAIDRIETAFHEKLAVSLFSHELDVSDTAYKISRFSSTNQASLLRLAKELIRIFSDRINVRELRKLSSHPEKEKISSNKLLQDILAQKIGEGEARNICGPIFGVYDMRLGDAHPTSSKISDALKLAGIDESCSYLRQGEQLIHNFGKSIWLIGKSLFVNTEEN